MIFSLPSPSTLALLLVGLALVLFVFTKLRHDAVALILLVAVALLGLVPTERLFEGFGHPAVITVGAVLVLSAGLQRAGVISLLTSQIGYFTQNRYLHLGFLAGVCVLASAFMNNVGALALLMPVAIASAAKAERPPAMLLMPLAFASMLGGMTTLIGTPPNLIISGFRQQALGEPFHMFDFSLAGVPVAVMGIFFLVLLGWRLIPKDRLKTDASRQLIEIDDYIMEVVIEEGSDLADAPLKDFPGFDKGRVEILGIRRKGKPVQPFRYQRMLAEDVLIVQADPSEFEEAISSGKISFAKGNRPLRLDEYEWEDVQLVEAIVEPGSPLIGLHLSEFSTRMQQGAVVLAVARRNRVQRTRLHEVWFQPGDILLIQGEKETVNRLFKRYGLLPLKERGLSLAERKRTFAALGIFALAVAASALGWLPATVAFTVACVVYVVAGILPVEELYAGVDWPVVILLGAMFPLGMALQETGASLMVAEGMLGLAEGWPAWAVLAMFLIVTMVVSDVVNNAATALLMAPIALSAAEHLGASPDALLMAVAIGASCAFLTPIGHQSNTLVMGPGGYKFSDYWRVGLPLEILIALVAVPLIQRFWA